MTGTPSVGDIYQETLALAEAGLIDPVENMREDQVYIFTGTLDSVVPPGMNLQRKVKMTRTKIHYTFVEMSPKIQNFYSQFMDENHIELKNDIAAEHGFVRYTEFDFL